MSLVTLTISQPPESKDGKFSGYIPIGKYHSILKTIINHLTITDHVKPPHFTCLLLSYLLSHVIPWLLFPFLFSLLLDSYSVISYLI